MKQLDDYTRNLKRPGWLWRYAMVLVAAFLLAGPSAIAQNATTDLTSCYGNCNSNDFTVTEVYLSSNLQGARLTPEACTEANAKVNAYLSFTFRNNTNSDRSGIFLSATINGIAYAICFPGVLPKKRSTTFTYNVAIVWQCGTDLILENTFVGWGSAGEQVCSISCSQATPSKCRYLGNQIVNTPLFPDFEFTASCANGNQFETISFDADKTSGGFNNYTYLWNFGESSSNSNTSTLEKPTHTYAAAGTYTVRLTVTDTQYELDASGNPTTTVISRQTKYKEQQVTVAACCTNPVITNKTATICSGGTFAVTPATGNGNTVPTNTTYTWSAPVSNPVNAITGGSAQATGVNSISQTLTNTTTNQATLTYTVTPKSGGCTGATFTVTVTVDPTSAGGSVGNAQNVCSGSQPANNLTLSNSVGSVIKWQRSTTENFTDGTVTDISNTTTTLLATTIGNLTADTWFRAVVKSGECAAVNSSPVKITVDDIPTTASVGSTQNRCGTLVSAALGGNDPSIGTGAWSKKSGPGTVAFSDDASASSTATVSVVGTYVFTWTISNGTCIPSSADITVNYYTAQDAPTLNPTPPTCSNSNGTVTVTAPLDVNGIDYEYSSNGGTDWVETTSFTVAAGAGYSIMVRNKNTTCVSTAATGTMASQPQAPATPVVTILTYPDCSSSTGTLKIVKSAEPLEEYGSGYEFSDNGEDWVESPVFNFTAGAGYSLYVRRISDNTCVASTSCQGEGSKITSQSSSSLQSIEQPKADDQLTAYPIPFSERTTLEFKAERDGNYEINLYDMKGTLIRQLKSGTAKAGEVTQIEVDGRSMADGMYLARMVSGSGAKTVKLLKKNR